MPVNDLTFNQVAGVLIQFLECVPHLQTFWNRIIARKSTTSKTVEIITRINVRIHGKGHINRSRKTSSSGTWSGSHLEILIQLVDLFRLFVK